MDYSPRGRKESDTAERLSTHALSTHSMHPLHLLSKLSWGSWLRPSFTPEWGPQASSCPGAPPTSQAQLGDAGGGSAVLFQVVLGAPLTPLSRADTLQPVPEPG